MKLALKFVLLLIVMIPSCSRKPEDKQENVGIQSSSDTIKIVGGVSYVNPQIGQFGPDKCRDVIDKAAMNEFKFTSKSEFKKAIKKAISDFYSQHSESESSSSSSIGAAIGDYVSFDSGNDQDRSEVLDIMKSINDNSTLDITDNDLLTIESKIVSIAAITAWQSCMHDHAIKESLYMEVSGDTQKEFISSVNWSPKSIYEPNAVKIANVSYTNNIKKIGDNELHKGAKLKKFTGISQKFSRIGKGKASITVNVNGYPTIVYEIPEPIVVINKPKPEYEKKWMREDESGNKYFESFIDRLPECYDCSDDDKYTDVSKELELTDKSGRIYSIDRQCVGGCGWSYNPDGGYAIKSQTLAPNKIIWFRRIKGPSTTETYTLYYEKERNICIKNCP